jgi:hypothetical protein
MIGQRCATKDQKMSTLDQCVSALCDLAKSGEQNWTAHVDLIVNDYLTGASSETAARRSELAERFRVIAPDRERSERIVARILNAPVDD